MLSNSVVLSLPRATHHVLQALATRLADLDLNPSEINTLANLAEDRPKNIRELTAATGTRASTLTSILNRLEHRGYITRELDPADRRSFRIDLTPSGRTVTRKIIVEVIDYETIALMRLTPRQLTGYLAVVAALQEHQ